MVADPIARVSFLRSKVFRRGSLTLQQKEKRSLWSHYSQWCRGTLLNTCNLQILSITPCQKWRVWETKAKSLKPNTIFPKKVRCVIQLYRGLRHHLLIKMCQSLESLMNKQALIVLEDMGWLFIVFRTPRPTPQFSR